MQSLCIFCGAAHGASPTYTEAAAQFGRVLAKRRIEMVWGGGQVGLMGVVADAVLADGGGVYGIIPDFMAKKELAHPKAQTMVVVDSMHERKALMAEKAEGFVALPGGFGTLDELFEIITWAQLHIHHKPIGLLNISGFFDPLLAMMHHLAKQKFVLPEHVDMLHVHSAPEALLDAMSNHHPIEGDWTSKVSRKRIPIR